MPRSIPSNKQVCRPGVGLSASGRTEAELHGLVPVGNPVREHMHAKSKVNGAGVGALHRPDHMCWLRNLIDENKRSPIHVTHRFAEAVATHVLLNLLAVPGQAVTLLMAIAGGFGGGKTVTTRECLRRLDVHVVEVSAAVFSSRFEGEPAERLDGFYLKAARHQRENGQPAAVLVHDLEMVIGEIDPGANATTNRQHMAGALMALADNPTCIRGEDCARASVFLTCNQLDTLYAGITEPHRTRAFTWEPNREERREIVRHILRDQLSPELTERMLALRPGWSFARYRAIAAAVEQQRLINNIGNRPVTAVLQQALCNPKSLRHAKPSLADDEQLLATAIAHVEASDQAIRTNHVGGN